MKFWGYLLALLMGSVLICVLEGAHCPAQEIGSFCTCDHGVFYEVNGTKVVCRAIRDPDTLYKEIQRFRGYEINFLLLIDLQVPFLPTGAFRGTSVKVMAIKDSIIDNLYSIKEYHPSPFDGLGESLEELNVYSTQDPSKWYWPSDLKNLTKLKKIEIVQSPIDFVGHTFAEIGGGSLETIVVEYSRVHRIHPQAFPELTNLREADFKGNFLPYLVRTMFPNPAPKLRKIDLSDNEIFTLNENMFENMPALKYLDLSQNQFKTFESVAYTPIWNNLRYFYISSNPFKCGCDLLPLKKKLISGSHPAYTDLNDVTCQQDDKKIALKELQCA